jgi:hypothetical protein
MMNAIKKAVTQRLGGDRPSPVRSFAAASVVGTAAGVVAYRLLRG